MPRREHPLAGRLILMVLVLVHEAGHMVVAKWCGMRVERFSIFFGRPIASFTRGETEYAIGWLPARRLREDQRHDGGGGDPPRARTHRAYSAAPTWKKVATILAGPAVNILLAIVHLRGDLLDRRAHVRRHDQHRGRDDELGRGRASGSSAGDEIWR